MENVWDHQYPGDRGMAINKHPKFGGIVDSAIVSGKWFVVPNDATIPIAEDFDTKQEAFAYLKSEIQRLAVSKSEY